jgi:hypothetical protein
MDDKIDIADVAERAKDLMTSLRKEGRSDLAAIVKKHVRLFKVPDEVRRSVTDLQKLLEQWRENPEDLPDNLQVRFEAEQLEDTCRLVLGIGTGDSAKETIKALPLTIIDRIVWLVRLVALALAIGGSVFGLPILAAEMGIDWIGHKWRYETPTVWAAQGKEVRVEVNILARAQLPDSTGLVEVYPVDRCRDSVHWDILAFKRWFCKLSDRQLADDGSPTYEMLEKGGLHGVLFAISNSEMTGSVGHAVVQVFPTEATPPGVYKIPLQGSYRGYRPGECSGFGPLRSCGKAVADENGEHGGLRVPTVVVRVTTTSKVAEGGFRTPMETKEIEEKRRAAEEAEAKLRQREQELAARIKEAVESVAEIQAAFAAGKWVAGRDRINELSTLHGELNAKSKQQRHPADYKDDLVELRHRLEKQREALKEFEKRVYLATFRALHVDKMSSARAAVNAVAVQFGIPVDYVKRLYDDRIGETKMRLKQLAEERLARDHAAWQAAKDRCGPSPSRPAEEIERYLRAVLRDPNASVGECLSPRLTDQDCWMVMCAFTAEDRSGIPARFRWRFFMEGGRVKNHLPP